ncbi:MAG: carbon starvation protein A [Bacteroidales bacterium]|nr:carbon starvation protein A [Bacteroidales bacterium]
MITFLCCITFLIAGFFTYGRFVEKRLFHAKPSRETPCFRMRDGVDYEPMKTWRVYIIQFLNIAGLGPIFGAILGAAYGPMAYLWITLGCVFMGAAHDYFSGMMSIRANGRSMPVVVGQYLGHGARKFMNVFLAFTLICVGCSFVTGPADLLNSMLPVSKLFWVIVIFAYYILATLLPINKIIGKIYPVFGLLLLFMALAVGGAMIVRHIGGNLPMLELSADSFRNYHSQPDKFILFPMMFVVISCGAISGFHSTQSPMMARCIENEKYGRTVFYGAMITEGIVAMIWATAAINYFGGPAGLNAAAADGNTPAIIVNTLCNEWLGKVGAVIAILGVVICPITSGDTAFRSLRLMLGDVMKVNQSPVRNRLVLALPVFLVAAILCMADFSVLWNYVGICNQAVATVMLWTFAKYLSKSLKHLFFSIPATFLTYVCVSYFLIAPHVNGGLALNPVIGYVVAGVATIAAFATFGHYSYRRRKAKNRRRLIAERKLLQGETK